MRIPARMLLVVLVLVVAGCDSQGWDSIRNLLTGKRADQAQDNGGQVVTPAPQVVNVQEAFEKVAAVALPAVVNISTNQKVRRQVVNPFGDNPLFRDFFEDFFGDISPRQQEFKTQSLGSGFIISADGYIVTNDHVVRNADEISVKLHDKRTLTAKVVGRDPKTDIAVIKVQESKLPVLKLGDSGKLKIGQWAIAVGNPFGLNGTLTVGVISAQGRSNLGIETYEDFIQTDASINPGNSGGPLLNIYGEVIGINTAVVAAGQGIGFAIPVNMARTIINQIISKGSIERGWLGIGLQKMTPELAESMKLKKAEGVLVNRVYENSPALRAGMREGDVIIEAAGTRIDDPSDLQKIVIGKPVGSELAITVIRDGATLALKLKTDKMPSDERIEKADSARPAKNTVGITVRELLPRERSALGGRSGIVVSAVDPGSPAEAVGIQEGDVLLAVNQQQLRSVREFNEAMASVRKGRIINILLQRGSAMFYVALRP